MALQRGTPDYRVWEAAQILALSAIGATKAQILVQLLMTEKEYRERQALIEADANPGGALFFWARFQAAALSRTADLQRAMVDAREGVWEEKANPAGGRPIRAKCVVKPSTFAVATLARALFDIDSAIIDKGLQLGVIQRAMPGGEPLPGAAAGTPPPAQVQNNYLLQILAQSADGRDPRSLSEEQMLAVLRRVTAERAALHDSPVVPSLEAGRS